jgi:hypothetical protein
MTEISAATQIAASPEQVWAILADLASYSQWNPLFREASGQLSTGNTITLKSTHPVNGRTMMVKARVLAAEPARELRWRSSLPGLMTGEHSFTLTPADGGTRLVQTEIYSGLLAHFSNRPPAASRPASRPSTTPSRIEPRTGPPNQDQPSRACKGSTEADPSSLKWS